MPIGNRKRREREELDQRLKRLKEVYQHHAMRPLQNYAVKGALGHVKNIAARAVGLARRSVQKSNNKRKMNAYDVALTRARDLLISPQFALLVHNNKRTILNKYNAARTIEELNAFTRNTKRNLQTKYNYIMYKRGN
jgi:hypothetical protein